MARISHRTKLKLTKEETEYLIKVHVHIPLAVNLI